MARNGLRDSVVVVTGASSGIGRATAEVFAQNGATVVLAARREDALRELAMAIEQDGGRALVVPTDVTDEQAVLDLARRAVQRFGRVDVWVNNAAVTLFGRLEETPPEAYRRVIETDLFGYINGARSVLPYFREQGYGTLINTSSVVSKTAQPYTSAYVVSKYGVVGLSDSLRMEVMDTPNIHVCTVFPATIDTPLFRHAANYSGRAVTAMPPVHDAEDVAKAIVECAKKPQREVFVGANAAAMAATHSMSRGRFERIYKRQVEQTHFLAAPAAPTEGNLFSPMPEWAKVSGGYKEPGKNGSVRRVAMVGAAGAAAAFVPSLLAVRWLLRRRTASRRAPRAIVRRITPRKGIAFRLFGKRVFAR